MNPKRVVGITLTVVVLLLLVAGARMAQTRGISIAEAPRIPLAQSAAQQQRAPAADANQAAPAALNARTTYAVRSAPTGDAATTTQTFILHGGWNAIYLEVEPVNTSPLVNIADPGEDPVWVYEKSTLETVFEDLAQSGALESVWTWNTPTSQIDYIVDPSEGLWDAPGWRRYIPEQNVGPDGVSRGFLTDLANLHANTAYLVKLRDDLDPNATFPLTVEGTPKVEDHQWVKGSYNLTGFPIGPGMAPTVDAFTVAGSDGAPPITEIRKLNSNGNWEAKMDGGSPLEHGKAYLVYYDDQDPKAPDNYTAPLHIVDAVSDGLAFTRGAAGRQHELTIQNLSADAVTVRLQLIEPTGAGVALYLTDDTSSQSLLTPVEVQLGPYEPAVLKLSLSASEQTGDGAALLQISSVDSGLPEDLGTRWQLPVSAEKGSLAGLWVGEVTVNDVSEGRLGTTDVKGGFLTIALRPREESGITGAAGLEEKISGNTSSVAVTLTLALPATEIITPTVRTGTGLYLRGYVFADTNQNGERDGDERGFAGRVVKATLVSTGEVTTTTTASDGGYLFEGLQVEQGQEVAYTLALDQAPTGYTDGFMVTPPVAEVGQPAPTPKPNAWPETVTLDEDGVAKVVYKTYEGDEITDSDFPKYDATDHRVEPTLNFGYVSTYEAYLYTGVCNDRLGDPVDLGDVVNGTLVTEIPRAALNPQSEGVDYQLLGGPASYLIYVKEPGAADVGVACGEIVVGAPTLFENGSGSAFTFRLILRVNENKYAAILPYYNLRSGQRISSANFSITGPLTATNPYFGDTSRLLDYRITIAPEDPLNPYKHKYAPDHDNLDAKFNPMNMDTVDPWLWESYQVKRHINLELTENPPSEGATPDDAIKLDWGGEVYGGLYTEVIKGIHVNDITVKGIFVIRQVLTGDELTQQAYDGTAGGE
jgi:hypothetical protein